MIIISVSYIKMYMWRSRCRWRSRWRRILWRSRWTYKNVCMYIYSYWCNILIANEMQKIQIANQSNYSMSISNRQSSKHTSDTSMYQSVTKCTVQLLYMQIKGILNKLMFISKNQAMQMLCLKHHVSWITN